MGRARKVVASDVLRQRNVARGIGADEPRRHPQPPELGGPEHFHHLRTRTGRRAAIEQAGRAPAATRVLVAAPPQHRFAARFVERRRAARSGKPEVERRLPRRDVREDAVPHDPAGQVLVEAEMDEGLEKVARLRGSDRHRKPDPPCHRVAGAVPIVGRVTEEGDEIARRGEPDTEDQRILRGVDQLIQALGIEASLHTDARGIRNTGKRFAATVGECPIGRRHGAGAGLSTVDRLSACEMSAPPSTCPR